MNAFAEPEYPASLAAQIDAVFTTPDHNLSDEVEDHLMFGIDWDDLVLDVMAKAFDIEATTRALLVFAPALGVIEGGDL